MSKSNPTAPESPLVSVIVPCFNLGPRLDETVASVRAQSHDNLELIVVDDGSTDPETLEGLDRLRTGSDALVLVAEHAGIGSALNHGLRRASGKYFLPLGDDLIDPPYITEAVAEMELAEELGVVYCQADLFGDAQGNWDLPPFSWQEVLLGNCIFSSALFRHCDWVLVGGYDETMAGREDHDFLLRVLGLGRQVHQLPGRYFHYRRIGDSTNDRLHAPDARPELLAVYERMFRNNTQLYREHAHEFMQAIFAIIDERNRLRLRYRKLEKVRAVLKGLLSPKR